MPMSPSCLPCCRFFLSFFSVSFSLLSFIICILCSLLSHLMQLILTLFSSLHMSYSLFVCCFILPPFLLHLLVSTALSLFPHWCLISFLSPPQILFNRASLSYCVMFARLFYYSLFFFPISVLFTLLFPKHTLTSISLLFTSQFSLSMENELLAVMVTQNSRCTCIYVVHVCKS